MSQTSMEITLRLIDKMTGPLKHMTGNVNQLEQSINTAQARLDKMAQAQARLDRTLSRSANITMVGAGAVAMGQRLSNALQQPLDVAMEFEATMSKVQALTRLDVSDAGQRKKMDALRDQAKLLGDTTSFSASQAAGAQSFLAMAGFDPDKIMQSMPGLLSLAKAGGTELQRTADIASNVLSGFGMTADQMGRLGDVMAYTFSSSNTNLEMLGNTMKYVAPIASKAGANLEQVAAMSGMLGDVGIKGEMAGTALRAVLIRLADPPTEAAKAFAALGVKTRDAQNNVRSITEIIMDLDRATKNLGTGKKLEYLSSISGAEAAAAMMELVSNSTKLDARFREIEKSAGGAADKIAAVMSDNLAGRKDEMLSALEGLYITIGDLLTPTVKAGYEKITQIIRATQAWTLKNKGLVQTVVTVVAKVGTAVSVFGAAAIAVSTALSAFGMLRYGLAVVGMQFTMLRLSVLGMGIGVASAVKQWDSVLPWLKSHFPALGNWLGEKIPKQMERFRDAGKYLKETWTGIFKQPTELTEPTIKAAEPVKRIPAWINQWKLPRDAQAMSSPVQNMKTVAKGDTLWAIAADAYGAGKHYQKIVTQNSKIIKDANKIYVGQVLNLGARRSLPDWATSRTNQPTGEQSPVVQPAITTSIVTANGAIVKQTRLLHVLQEVGKRAFGIDIVDQYGKAIEWVQTVVHEALDKMAPAWDKFRNTGMSAIRSLIAWASDNASMIGTVAGVLAGGFMGILATLPQRISSISVLVGELLKSIGTQGKPRLIELKNQFVTLLSTITLSLGNRTGQIKEALGNVASRLIKEMGGWLDWLNNKAKDGSISRWLDNLLLNLEPVLVGIGEFSKWLVLAAIKMGRFVSGMARFLGGWDVLAKIFAGGWLIAALSGFLQGLAALGGIIGFILSPLGLLVGMIAAMAIGARMLYLDWETLSLGSKVLGVSMIGLGAGILSLVAYMKIAAMWTTITAAAQTAWNAVMWLGRAAMMAFRGVALVSFLMAMAGSFSLAGMAAGAASAGAWLLAAAMAVLTSPIVLIIAALAALAAGIYYAYSRWDELVAWWNGSELKEHTMPIYSNSVDYASSKWEQFAQWWNGATLDEKLLGVATAPVQIGKTLASDFFGYWLNTSLGQKTLAVGTDALATAKSMAIAFTEWWFAKTLGQKSLTVGVDSLEWAKTKATEFRNWWESWTLSSKAAEVVSKVKRGWSGLFGSDAETTTPQFGGGRATGGAVTAGHFYEVNEQSPELLQIANRTLLMMGNQHGNVIPLPKAFHAANDSMYGQTMPRITGMAGNLAVSPLQDEQDQQQPRPALHLVKPAPAPATASAMTVGSVQLHVHPSQGMDELALADLVDQRLRDLLHQIQSKQHGVLYDAE